jgi:hypothetical protein
VGTFATPIGNPNRNEISNILFDILDVNALSVHLKIKGKSGQGERAEIPARRKFSDRDESIHESLDIKLFVSSCAHINFLHLRRMSQKGIGNMMKL